MSPSSWSIAEARERALGRGAGAVVDELLQRLAARSQPGVWISITAERVLRTRSEALDAIAATGRTLPLHGVPFAVKDNIDVAGVPTTAGSRAFSYLPTRDAPAVARVLAAGAIFVGKTNLDQFATDLSGTHSPDFAMCANPVDPGFIAGGSSSGSAVAVATGLVPFALGTDTAGSGRVPAACCGVVGFKPTRERIDNTGLVAASPSFDTVSVLSTSSVDAAIVFGVLAERDHACRMDVPRSNARIGVPNTLAWFGDDDARRCFEGAIARLEALRGRRHGIDISPFLEAGALLYGSALVGGPYTSFGEFALDPGPRAGSVGAFAPDGPIADAPSVFRALRQLARMHTATTGVWNDIDVLVVPTIARHPTVAEARRERLATNRDLGTYTNFVNLLDLAAVAVPAGTRASGLPFGVSLIGPAFSDHALLSLASTFLGETVNPSTAGAAA